MRRFEGASLRAVALWDEALCLRANGVSSVPWVRVFFRAISRLGDGVVWYALMGVLLLAGGAAALVPVAQMVAVGIAGVAVYKLLKSATSRPRPYRVQSAIRPGADPLDEWSFPSGHTLHAVAFTVVATVHYPLLAGALVPLTLAIAASRVVLGLHYPSDVLAGAAIGALIAGLSLAAF